MGTEVEPPVIVIGTPITSGYGDTWGPGSPGGGGTGGGGSTGGGGDGGGGHSGGGGTGDPVNGTYYDGHHWIRSMAYTEKYTPGDTHHTKNNPGNLHTYAAWMAKYGASTTSVNGFVAFSSEQGGRNSMGALLDGSHYGGDTMQSFVTDGYNGGTPAQQQAEQHNIVAYMQSHGYPNAAADTTSINSMSADKFNTLLDAVTNAEGETNM